MTKMFMLKLKNIDLSYLPDLIKPEGKTSRHKTKPKQEQRKDMLEKL